MNENHIKKLEIKNFKSIKEMELDCSRINVFVGKPNVGKSNILEAIGLYGLGHNNPDSKSFLLDNVRYENLKDLFHFENFDQCLKISSNLGDINISLEESGSLLVSYTVHNQEQAESALLSDQIIEDNEYNSSFYINANNGVENSYKSALPLLKSVKKYIYAELNGVEKSSNSFLQPPYGQNLISVIQSNKELREIVGSFIKYYGLEFVIDTRNNTMGVQRKFEDGLSYILPYSLTADTFQRMIFNHAAILSNKESIIIFEEPESNAYPPYISQLAEKIVDDESDNQYFITTHSPFIFNKLIEKTKEDELAAFVVNYENHETKLYKLTDKDMSDLLDHGADIFYNLNWFIDA